MKKLLAMVLALVMTLSLAVSANAAFKDADKVNDDYAEAVAVLNGMGVFKGYEDGSFKPEGNITRAEVATIVYRIYTADVAKNDKSGLYATYNKFSDMAGASWAAGYIGYCANASLVKGYPDGTFKPSGNVTGYEVLAMILRAVGYDKNNEFSGADWALHVAQTAQQLGVLDNVAKTTDLNAPASRELVAELLFQGIQKAQVTYTPAFGYVTDKVTGKANSSLGTKNFDLKSAKAADVWGRPATTWSYNTGDKTTTVVAKPVATFNVATTECDIAAAYGLKTEKTFTVYTNGAVNKSQYIVQAKDTVQKLGAQGRLLEVYDNDTIVMIDTYFAEVTNVKDATFDNAGHLRTDAEISLTVYNGMSGGQKITLKNGDENYTYAKGDKVLVNAVMDNTSDTVKFVAGSSTEVIHVDILNVAESIEGAQTFLWYNSKQHTVEGTNYDDADKFILDQAGFETSKHTWYFDNYGNLIAATDIATQYAYGVIENIQWQNPALSNGYAQATIRYMDGTTETKVVTSINGNPLTYANSGSNATRPVSLASGFVSTTMQENAAEFFGTDLYRIETAADGTVALKHVFTDKTATKAEFKNELAAADVKTGIAAIQGTGADGVVYVNSNTTFLIRSGDSTKGFTYTVVKGYENVGNFTKSNDIKVDYVYGNNGQYADYVYITGPADAATGKQMFYLTSSNVQAVLDNGVKYFVLTGILDGEANKTIQVKYNTALGGSATALNDSNVAQWAKDNLNRMFTIEYQDSQIVNVWGPKSDITSKTLEDETGNIAYHNLKMAYYADTNNVTASYDGYVLALGGEKYNVVGLTPTYGEFSTDMTNKAVYVVYDYTNTIQNAYVAKYVYIADLGTKQIDSDVNAKAVINYKIKVIDNANNTVVLLDAATDVHTSAVNTSVAYADLVAAMQNPGAGFTPNADTLAYLTAQGLLNAPAVAQSVNVGLGYSQDVVFTIAK